MTHREAILLWGFIALFAFAMVLAFEAWIYRRIERKREQVGYHLVPQDYEVVHIIEQVRLPVDWEQEEWLNDEPVVHDWREEGWA